MSSHAKHPSATIKKLWVLYGYTYDGLLAFWPYRHLLDLVEAKLRLRAGLRVLDLGCGTGNMLVRSLGHAGVTATGVDASSSMLKVAGRKLRSFRDAGHLELVQADVQAYLEAQPDNSYDRIISVNVLYAIADQTALWKELMRVLSPNGAIIATTSVRPGSGPIIKEHFEHSSVWVLLRPRLIGVFLIDALINIFGHTGHFAFPDEAKLRKAVAASGASWVSTDVCYGGPQNGVNILFEVTHQPGA